MKRIQFNYLFLLSMMLSVAFPVRLQSQTSTIEYTYDAAGNRTGRAVIVLRSVVIAEEKEEQPFVAFDLFADLSVRIHPNPTKGFVTVVILNLQQEQQVDLLLFDITGKMLISKQNAGTSTDMDLSGYVNGTYILKVVSGENVYDWKIIKQ